MQSEGDTKGTGVSYPPPLITLAVVGLAYGLDWMLPLPISESGQLLNFGIGVLIFALAIIANAAISFYRAKTHIEPWKPTTSIIYRGVFSISRNPIYLAFCISCIGLGLILNSWWILLSFMPLMGLLYVLVIRLEEAYLTDKFGDKYVQYQQRVRRWL